MENSQFEAVVLGREGGLVKLDLGKYTPSGNIKKQARQIIFVAEKFLPPRLKKGDKLTLEFFTTEQFLKRKKNTAQAILDELTGSK